jgi:antitoxin (DNA-binding transcriptional repressor) of toxin-antitoxin stability system
MKTITMLQLRTNSRGVVRLLRRGERMTLSYRGLPLARLEPVRTTDTWSAEDPVFKIHHAARPSPRGPLSHDQIDEELYGRT